MTNSYYIRIVIDTSGAIGALGDIAKSVDQLKNKAEKAANFFRTMFIFGIAKRGIEDVLGLGDAYSDLETKVRNASGKNDKLSESMDKVFAAANRARVDVSAFGKTVLAISGATANMNLGFDASVRMSETLSKMMRLGGATVGEARSAMLQYGQALRKGKLNGDEMRSVMENSIELQKALAKSLGISTDELLKYSKAGKITREVMVDALVKQADEVDRKFALMSGRVVDAWTVITNAAVRFAGQLNLNETLSPILLFIADNFDTIGKAAVVAASILGVVFVRQGVLMAISALQKLYVLIVSNPFTALIAGIVAGIVALKEFGGQWKLQTDGIATVSDLLSYSWEKIVSGIKFVGSEIAQALGTVTGAMGGMVDVSKLSFGDVLVFGAIMADKLIATFTFMKDAVVHLFEAMSEKIIDALNLVIDALNDLGKRFQKTGHFLSLLTDDVGLSNRVRGTDLDPGVIPKDRQDAYGALTRGQNGITAPFKAPTKDQVEELAKVIGNQRYDLATEQGYGGGFDRVPNPFEGKAKSYVQTIVDDKDKWDMAMDDLTGTIQKKTIGFLKDVETFAHRPKPPEKMGLADPGGKQGAVEPDNKAIKAREKAIRDYVNLEAKISDVGKAQKELINAQRVLDAATKVTDASGQHHLVTQQRAAEIMAIMRERVQDLLDPYGALLRNIDKEVVATKNLSGEWDVNLSVLKQISKLRQEGIQISTAEIALLKQQSELAKGMQADQARKTSILTTANYVSPEEQRSRALTQAQLSSEFHGTNYTAQAAKIEATTFSPKLESAGDKYAQDIERIVQIGDRWRQQGVAENVVLQNQASLLESLNTQYDVLNQHQTDISEGIVKGWDTAFESMGHTAADTAKAIQDVFSKLSDAIVEFVTTGTLSWDKFAIDILASLSRIATNRLIWELMNLAGGAIVPTGNPISAVTSPGGLPTHAATGGVFKVHGPPGQDNVPANFMLSAGEHFAVWPRGVNPQTSDRQNQSGGDTFVMVVKNEQEAALAIMQSPAGRRVQVKNIAYSENYLRTLQKS